MQFPDFNTAWGTVLLAGYLASLVLIPAVLLTRRKHRSATVAWLLSILFLPYLGALLFVVFGINRVERRKMRKRQATRHIEPALTALSQDHAVAPPELDDRQRSLERLSARLTDTVATQGNAVEVLPETHAAFDSIEQAIRSAQSSLHVQYYIWRSDETGTRLRNLLIQKAEAGLQVRFLYDGLGSMSMSNRFLVPMREAGIRVASFLPGPSLRERWQINLRNHRKLVIVDGETAFTGGLNVGDEYLGKNPAFGYWRDTQIKLHGPAVLQMQQVFAEDWYYATNEELLQPDYFPDPQERGNVAVQVLADGPDREVGVFLTLMFAAITEARERVTLATSYFVPPPSLVAALCTAAYRGVRVRLLVARKATYLWTLMAGRSYYESLLRAGVEIYEYDKGLFHAKTLTIDGSWSLVGTPNFDMRSFMLNFEVGIACYDANIAAQLEDQFDQDAAHSTQIHLDEWLKRPTGNIIGENFWRLFAPLL
jgi:cardiolipin synthase A/B